MNFKINRNILVMSILSAFALALLIILAIRSEAELASILLTIFLTSFSIGIGVWANKYYSEKAYESQEQEKLENYAIGAFRLSKSIDEAVRLSLGFLRKKIDYIEKLESDNSIFLDVILKGTEEQLLIIRRLLLSANENWQDILPQDKVEEIKRRTIDTITLAESRDLVITEEEFLLEEFENDEKAINTAEK